ncbi:hypothetical protein KI387_012412 [Taxus chinensis]|uniref:Uncharacterized protein n=1 Tax=Taxus chinensis TaxID=29808 RepID=A0AA38CPH8_TAXCH|nr:hypothetical protein KI387_012412 [Taxus chinensis]
MEVATAGSVWHLQRQLMEDLSERRVDAMRPLNLGFPLGTVVLLFVVLGISALFSCCYHWEKIKFLYSSHTRSILADTSIQIVRPNMCDAEFSSPPTNLGVEQEGGMLAVKMPGDQAPNFIAMPSPRVFPPSLQPK